MNKLLPIDPDKCQGLYVYTAECKYGIITASKLKGYNMKHIDETKQRFGIRKFSIGVGSVLLGTLFMVNPVVANAQGTTTSGATGTAATSTTGSESYVDYLKLELTPGNTKTEFFADEDIINDVKVTLEGINQTSQELYLEYEIATKSPVVTTSTKEVTGVAPTEVEIAEIGSYIHHKSQRYEIRNGERYHINTYHQKSAVLYLVHVFKYQSKPMQML